MEQTQEERERQMEQTQEERGRDRRTVVTNYVQIQSLYCSNLQDDVGICLVELAMLGCEESK